MKHLLLTLCLLPSLLVAVTGDLTCTIRPDGYSAVITFAGGNATTTKDFDYRGWMRSSAQTGTFTIGETITQTTSLATALVIRKEGVWMLVDNLTGTALGTTVWTGGASGATFTPETTPAMTEPGPGTPYLTVTSLGYDSAGVATTYTRILYFTEFMRVPNSTEKIPGGTWANTFADGAVATGSVSLVTGIVVGDQSGGSHLWLKNISGAENVADVWTASGAASFMSSSTGTASGASDPDIKVTAAGMKLLVSFSGGIYDKDDTGAGNSLTAPTFTMPAGAIVSNGANSVVATAAAVTNDSALAHTLACGQWDHYAGVCVADRVTGNFNVAFNGRHAEPEIISTPLAEPTLDRIAAVKITATGQTSANIVTVTVTSQAATRRTATGLYGCSFIAPIPITGFTTGELIDLRAQAYPRIGDSASVLDTNSFTTATDEIRGKNKATIVYSSTPKYAIIDSVSGNNANTGSTTEATARAAPIQHIGKAIQNDCTVIKLLAGTHAAIGTLSATRRASNEWYRVIPDDGLTSADVTVQLSTVREWKCARIQYEGVKVTLAGTTSYLGGDAGSQANFIRFKDCVFDGSGVATPIGGPCYDSYGGYFLNCTGDLNRAEWKLMEVGSTRVAAQFDGCTIGSTGDGAITCWYRVMACSGTNGSFFGPFHVNNPAPAHENFLFEHNRFTGHSMSVISLSLASVESCTIGGSVIGNLIERLDALQPVMWLKGDGTALDCKHVVFANNTATGDRCSLLYADIGGGTPYYCINNSVEGNIFEVLGTKHDTFSGYALDGRRVWAWNALYGNNWRGNISAQHTSMNGANSFLNEYIGLRGYQSGFSGSNQPRAGTTAALTYVTYVDRKSGDGAGVEAGGGDYRLRTASPAYRSMMGRVLPYDFNGKPRSRNRDSAGAYAEGGSRPASMFFAQ